MNNTEVTYYIDKEKGTTTCEITNTKDFFLNFVSNNLHPYALFFFDETHRQHLYMPEKFVGKAVCSPEDEFNLKYGQRLAYSRAKKNMSRSFFKRANYFANYLDERITYAVNKFDVYGSKLARNAKRNTDWLAKNVQQNS